MRVTYSRRSLAQIDAIASYIARDNAAAASALLVRIERLALLIGRFPQMGRMTDQPESG